MNLFELSSNWKNLYELDSEDMEVFPSFAPDFVKKHP